MRLAGSVGNLQLQPQISTIWKSLSTSPAGSGAWAGGWQAFLIIRAVEYDYGISLVQHCSIPFHVGAVCCAVHLVWPDVSCRMGASSRRITSLIRERLHFVSQHNLCSSSIRALVQSTATDKAFDFSVSAQMIRHAVPGGGMTYPSASLLPSQLVIRISSSI